MTIITSKTNNLIKKTKKLLSKKYRKNAYLIEGWHLLEEAQKAQVPINHIFVVEGQEGRLTHDNDKLVLVTQEVLKELTDSPTPQGVIAEVQLEPAEWQAMPKGRFLVLEDVQDPGNVGTMIRTADAAGYDAVFISNKTADIYNQKTLRSMQGSHFHLPIYRVDMAELMVWFAEVEVPVLATTLADRSVDYRTLPKMDHFALIMGNEGRGITADMTERADYLVHIPMAGQAESLNVAVAAGIVMFSLV